MTSIAFIDAEIEGLNQRGYKLKEATVNFILYWQRTCLKRKYRPRSKNSFAGAVFCEG